MSSPKDYLHHFKGPACTPDTWLCCVRAIQKTWRCWRASKTHCHIPHSNLPPVWKSGLEDFSPRRWASSSVWEEVTAPMTSPLELSLFPVRFVAWLFFIFYPSLCWMLPRGLIVRSFLLLLLLFSSCKGVTTSPFLTWKCPASQKVSDSERTNVAFESGPFPNKPAAYWDPRTIKLSLSEKKTAFLLCTKPTHTNPYATEATFCAPLKWLLPFCTDPLNFVPSDPLVTLSIRWTCTWESQRQTGHVCLQ